MYLSDIFTIPINIAGNGGLSLPVGLGESSGLPVGVQIIGPQFGDQNIIQVASALEASYDIARIAPAQTQAATPGAAFARAAASNNCGNSPAAANSNNGNNNDNNNGSNQASAGEVAK
jgi:hypothetical protein